jgi:DNA helicase II / ATP-dependent DNA helicase PcrA
VSFSPSPQQEAIFENIASGEGHSVVSALAGCGKSSSILRGLDFIPKGSSTLLVAFNKNIAKRLESEVPPGVMAWTLHSYGLRQISRAISHVRPEIDEDKMVKILREMVPLERDRAAIPAIGKLVSLAKGCLAHKAEAIDALIDDYDLSLPIEVFPREEFVALAGKAMDRSLEVQNSIDFDDMVWFPCVLKMPTRQFDRVFIDECQDLNAAQMKLALKGCEPSGRICAVGDKHQAIYQFRGADHHAFDNLVQKLDAEVLGLTTTFRCAKKIVELARTIVPEFEAAPGAPPGIVRDVGPDQLVKDARPGDFVLSRTNAPLLKLCFRLAREGRPVAIQGRDIGARLKGVVFRLSKKTGSSLFAFLAEVEKWRDKEVERLTKLERSTANVVDTAACIEAVSEDASDLDEVISRIDRAFADGESRDRIVLSSTHKAKGLERDRVWMLSDTFLRGKRIYSGGKMVGYDRPDVTERNLFYVCVTRAKRELIRVSEGG